jgi:3-hydroxyisobutyrate dehydrogenase-like beta-hydroxyacid dehydrogenase
MAPTPDLRVGFLGVGKLGGPVLGAIVRAGWPVTAFDPRPEALAPFGEGLRAVGSAAEVAAASDVVSVLVNDGDQVRAAVTGPGGLVEGAEPGLVVAVHSTIDHVTLREVAGAAAEHDVIVIDAPLSGTMGEFSIPDLCAMVGGDPAAAEKVRPVFESFAGLIVHLGPLGAGLDAKIARNAMAYQWWTAVTEGLALSDAAGLDRAAMWEIMGHTGLTGFHPQSIEFPLDPNADRAALLDRARHQTLVAQKDLRAALARADELGVAMPLTAADVDAVGGYFEAVVSDRAGRAGGSGAAPAG